MDFVDVTIIGVLAFWLGFGIGIVISANNPTKAENEQELKDYGYLDEQKNQFINDLNEAGGLGSRCQFGEARDKISVEISTMNLIEKFMPLVDSAILKDDKLFCSREKNLANAKQCALIAVDYAERVLSVWGKENDELQNMDGEWRRIDSLKKAIERYEG